MNPSEGRAQVSDSTAGLERLLVRLREAESEAGAGAGKDQISFDAILDAVGRRSFGPLLLLAGVVTLMPLVGDIPGVPTLMGLFVVLTAAQLLLGRDNFWLPGWLLRRSVDRSKIENGVSWLRRPAGWIDRVLRPRLSFLVEGPGAWVVGVASLLVGLAMPPMELVPFSANIAGLALSALGLALITKDGILAIVALLATAAGYFFVIRSFF
jgi:hypothetical protein